MTELGIAGRIIRVMLACPGDIYEEINIFFEVINEWNKNHAEEYRIVLLPKHWSTHSHPRLDGRPQSVINSQLVSKADLLVAVIGNKLGTSTGVAESGTVEEILEFYGSNKPVKLYFAEIASLSPDQAMDKKIRLEISRVNKFKARAKDMGIYWPYGDLVNFREQFSSHLMQEVRQIRDGFADSHNNEDVIPVVKYINQDNATTESIKIMLRAIQKLQIEWLGEANTRLSRYDSGKHIMSKLFSVLSTHLPELEENISEDKIDPIKAAIPNIMSIRNAYPVMGGNFREEFWGMGTEVFSNLVICTKNLSTP